MQCMSPRHVRSCARSKMSSTRAAALVHHDGRLALLDEFLKLLGTNRTRMQWKMRAWKRSWERRVGTVKNRAQVLTYEHQTCPRCSHPASADEKVCTRCGESL